MKPYTETIQLTHADLSSFRVGDVVKLAFPERWRPWYVRFWRWWRPMFELYGLAPRDTGYLRVSVIDHEKGIMTVVCRQAHAEGAL